ncbi:MAG: GTPase HflX, partial [Deltaproteobacteria bacterium]|nr:GTPase HflX [Deltaproteobacteria bacterium]
MSELSAELHRELGLLVDRGGHIEWVIVGDAGRIYLPDIGRTRADPTRLRGLRLIHTQFNGQPIAHDDVTDLTLLRLDLVATISVAGDGLPGDVHTAHILPDDPAGKGWAVLPSAHPSQLDVDVVALVSGIEEELARLERARAVAGKGERTILVSVYTGSHEEAEVSMRELEELARTSRLVVLDRICQRRRETDPRHLLGKGKLEELLIRSMQLGADVLVFDQNLTPVQAKLLS